MFSIEYGPKGNRVAISRLKLSQVLPAAEALIEGGAVDLRIIDQRGARGPGFGGGTELVWVALRPELADRCN